MSVRRRSTTSLLILLLGLSATPPLTAQEGSPAGHKSPGVALAFSFLGTALPAIPLLLSSSETDQGGAISAMLLGVFFGPSFGHFYAGRSGRALAGLGIRTGALLGLVGAVTGSWRSGAATLGDGALALGAASALLDIATAGHSADLTNQRNAVRRVTMSVLPGPGARGATLGVRIAF